MSDNVTKAFPGDRSPVNEAPGYTLPAVGILQAAAAAIGAAWMAEGLRVEELPEDGRVSPAMLTELAADLGLLLHPEQLSIAQVDAQGLPVLVPLLDGGAVVVQRISRGRAEYRDASLPRGVKSAAVAELALRSSGWIARIARLPEAAEANETATGGAWFWRNILSFWPHYLLIMLAAAVANVLALGAPLFAMALYDRVIPNAAMTTLGALTIALCIAMLLDLAIRQMRTIVVEGIGRRVDRRQSRRLFDQIIRLKLSSRPTSAGEAASEMAELDGLRDLLTSTLPVTLIDMLFAVLFLIVIAVIGGMLALIPLAGMLLSLALGLAFHQPAAQAARRARTAEAEKQGQLVETMAALEAIKVWRAESQFRRRWSEVADRRAEIAGRSRVLQQSNANLALMIQQGTNVALLLAATFAVLDQRLTMGGVIAISMLAARAQAPAAAFGALLVRFAQGRHALRLINELMARPTEALPGTLPSLRGLSDGSLAMRNVTFSFPNQPRPALQDVSFAIAPGERVALVGRVGSGKSSIARLLTGLYDGFSGSVLVGGLDVRQISPQALRRDIGYAMQDFCLVRGTLYENLTLGLPEAPRDQVMRAAYAAGLDEVAALHPLGFGMPVAEQGRNLSGGLRQSIVLARALIGRPRLIILDEPTSAMDNVAEARVVQRLRAHLGADQTLVVITHRSALLDLATRMIVLDAGRVASDGNRESVMRHLRDIGRANPRTESVA